MYANIEKASNIQKNLKNNQNNSFNRSNSYNMLSFRDGSILADKNKSKEIVEDIVNKLNTKSKDISNLRIARNKLNYSSNNLDNLNSKEKNNFLSNIHNYNDIFEKSLTSHNNTTKNIHLKSNHRNYSNNKSAIINNNYNKPYV